MMVWLAFTVPSWWKAWCTKAIRWNYWTSAHLGVGCYDLKDKNNAKTNQFSAAARKPVSEYRLARLGSPSPSRSHIGRRGAPDRIRAVDCWRNRMARRKP